MPEYAECLINEQNSNKICTVLALCVLRNYFASIKDKPLLSKILTLMMGVYCRSFFSYAI